MWLVAEVHAKLGRAVFGVSALLMWFGLFQRWLDRRSGRPVKAVGSLPAWLVYVAPFGLLISGVLLLVGR